MDRPLLEPGLRLSDWAPSRYRYNLFRRWWTEPHEVSDLWVMLNPSTADEEVDDPTIRRCIGFSRRDGLSGLRVVNLFALRSTDPAGLADAWDPVGPENDAWIRDVAARSHRIVVAWGAHPLARTRIGAVVPILRGAEGRRLWCLGTTASGAPRHPLYVRGDTTMLPWGE